MVVPKKPGELLYKEICEQRDKHFLLKPLKIAEKFCFYNHRQLSKETVAEYLAELRKLAINVSLEIF